jgi:hypothetical protein
MGQLLGLGQRQRWTGVSEDRAKESQGKVTRIGPWTNRDRGEYRAKDRQE